MVPANVSEFGVILYFIWATSVEILKFFDGNGYDLLCSSK